MHLVHDFNQVGEAYSSEVAGARTGGNNEFAADSFAQLGGYWYFAARTLATGTELYRTDGTAAGTSLVRDIRPGPDGSGIASLVPMGNHIYFRANDGVHGAELWRTDGTPGGTELVHDVRPGEEGSSAVWLTAWNGRLWFVANDGANGAEVWSTDGTSAGTSMLADIHPSGGSSPRGLVATASGGHLLFRCNDGTHGAEPWATDGTAAGTAMVADIRAGSSGSGGVGFVVFDGDVLFAANDNIAGTELWQIPDPPTSASLRADIRAGSASASPDLSSALEFQGELYFAANGGNGVELWKTSATQTVQVWDVHPNGSSSPKHLRVHGGDLYFAATASGDRELRRISAAGVQSTLPLNPAGSGLPGSNANLMSWNGQLWFRGQDDQSGWELGACDGTTAAIAADIEPGSGDASPDWLTPISATQMLFAASTEQHGTELWTTDGTTAGTVLLVELDATITTGGSAIESPTTRNGDEVLFGALGPTGHDLWRWREGEGVVSVLGAGSPVSPQTPFAHAWVDGEWVTFFGGGQAGTGTELWRTDGTAAGTWMVKEVQPGTGSGVSNNEVVVAGD
ncbi:MAG: hypothetical protein KAI24_10645, partial [Planctomycetes bacterium]|nr:hypothetical protein [Planctomycetota bacterium]